MVVSIIVGAGTVVTVLYLGVGDKNVTPGILGRDIVLAASIFRNRPCFLVAVAWIHIVWLVVMDVGMLRYIYLGIGYGTILLGVLGHDIVFAALFWGTKSWFLLEVAWVHSV